jgi:hypothetical protein
VRWKRARYIDTTVRELEPASPLGNQGHARSPSSRKERGEEPRQAGADDGKVPHGAATSSLRRPSRSR